MRILVVQPHRDDAVFSICEHMITWIEDDNDVSIVTMFGGVPTDQVGWLKHARMRAEHETVMNRLEIEHSDSTFLDAVYEPRPEAKELKAWLRDMVFLYQPDVVVRPRGIHHTDHMMASDVVQWSWSGPVWVYDELPYYVMHPHEATPETWEWKPGGCRSHLDEKKRLCRLYASQIGETEERCLWAPERLWEAS